MKENYLPDPVEIQKKIWGKTCGVEGLNKRTEQAKKGWIPRGLAVSELSNGEKGLLNVLGEFAPRVLVASSPDSLKTLIPEQLAIAGGWCAIRTKDAVEMGQQGIIMDPFTGEIEKITSVEQVASWIQDAVAFDQIVESVGAVNASEYAVISERKLWSMRVTAKMESIFGRMLSEKERNLIEKAIENADSKRAYMTKRYIEYVTGKENIIFQRVVDEDIWGGLQKARDEMFCKAELSLDRFKARYPNEQNTISYTSLVWAMYSEPYFDMLRQEGYINSKKVFVVEPSLHAAVETLADLDMAVRIYHDRGIYHDSRGFNANTGFIAYLECVSSKGRNVRKDLFIGQVPNISNWKNLFKCDGLLDPGRNTTLTINENQLFIWGANLLPFGSTKAALLKLADIQDEFKKEKERLNSEMKTYTGDNKDGRMLVQKRIDALRRELDQSIVEQNIIIARNLKGMFEYVIQGLKTSI